MPELTRYGIFHPIDGDINSDCNVKDYAYEYVTTIFAENLVRSFYNAQCNLNPDYFKLGRRNTTVGDLITSNDKLYMVKGDGNFKRIPTTKTLYKDIMQTDEAIIEILSRRTLTQDDVNDLIENSY
jgi:hypothetical protein